MKSVHSQAHKIPQCVYLYFQYMNDKNYFVNTELVECTMHIRLTAYFQ